MLIKDLFFVVVKECMIFMFLVRVITTTGNGLIRYWSELFHYSEYNRSECSFQ